MNNHFLLGVLGQLSIFAWMLLVGAIVTAVWKLKSGRPRALAIAIVLIVFAAFPGRWAWETQERVEANRARYETASAMFYERCSTKADYKIYKVVEDVEDVDGILLPKVRHKTDEYDPMAPGAAFASEAWDDGYIGDFLSFRYSPVDTRNPVIDYSPTKPYEGSAYGDSRVLAPGFSYVDVIDEKDRQRYRVTGHWEERWLKDKRYLKGDIHFSLDRVLSTDPAPRYAVTFEDSVIPEERQYGIASSTVKVIDTQTNEVIAEMVRYVYYPGKLGAGAGANWGRANQCPGFVTQARAATRFFVDHVLVARGSTPLPTLK